MTVDLNAIANDLEKLETKGRGGQPCRVQALVKDFPEAEDTIRTALTLEQYSAARVAGVLTKNGLTLSEASIKRHRRGECVACNKENA